jgi:hypothetical protein
LPPVSPTPQPTQPNTIKLNNFEYPIRAVYINKINHWWPPQSTVLDLAVPSEGKKNLYNFIILAFWSYNAGPLDAVSIWADPVKYFGGSSLFGSTKDQIQKNLKAKYNNNGMKILVSAFGAT